MIQYVTPLDWIIWIVGTALEISILLRTWVKLPMMAAFMIYMLIESGAALALIFSHVETYTKATFLLNIPEYMLIGLAAIELCCKLQPSGARRVIRLGPIIIAAPLFFSIVIMIPMAILTMLRMNELAYILSALLLLLCLLFEEVAAEMWAARAAWGYLMLLGLLVVAIELLYRMGNRGIWNRSIPVAWLLGLGGLVLSLRPKHGERSAAH
jgi:hypothetical protein